MLNEIYKKQKEHSEKCIEGLKRDFSTLRTGKVNISIVDNIYVDYYGSQTPLNQVATVLTSDAKHYAVGKTDAKNYHRSDLCGKHRRKSEQRRREREAIFPSDDG